MNIWQLNQAINNFLETVDYQDNSINGLQVESKQTEIQTVALAVDSGLAVIEEAVKRKADLLLVHHGLFWGQSTAITGALAKKIDTLLSGSCSLMAQHLPLDGNPFVGNNYQLAKLFQMENLHGFCSDGNGKFIGCGGTLPAPKKIEYFIEKAQTLSGFGYQLKLDFGKKDITSCGIISGSAASYIKYAYNNYDLFISGEPKQEVYHEALENNQSALFLGHYATETVGIKSLGQWLEDNFQLNTFFIDQPTGI